MMKLDLKKDFKELYSPSAKVPQLLEVPAMQFAMINGKGDPNTSQEYKEAVQALYSVSYTLKFAIKKQQQTDYSVMALEGLWWLEDDFTFDFFKRDNWRWTMMIMQPEVVTPETFKQAVEEVIRKKGLEAAVKLRLETFDEGLSVQMLHLGPYSEEPATIEKLHHFMEAEGYVQHGNHHEIYLSDPTRTAPEKLKTILRLPVQII
ncbi:MAG TPA: GyrI-like domain-containing protein [Chloroflexia bacterium]|nr:GyrI-like domain-containing protein [Chloroflexia bacterium]